jgi:hypothetical protein
MRSPHKLQLRSLRRRYWSQTGYCESTVDDISVSGWSEAIFSTVLFDNDWHEKSKCRWKSKHIFYILFADVHSFIPTYVQLRIGSLKLLN